jgi:D-amino-acid oxidase
MKEVTVVGCGISGLSCALLLAKAGHQVSIVAKDMPPHTTSDRAAAFWSPYYAEGKRVTRWAKESYFEYERLAAMQGSGVSLTTLHRFRRKNFVEADSWRAALPEGKLRVMEKEELPAGYDEGFEVAVPLIETQIFLPWLMNEFRRAGGQLKQQEIFSMHELNANVSAVIVCVGLGAKQLLNDENMMAVKGQIVVLDAHLPIPILLDESLPTYIVQRQDGCIAGGTREENVYTETTEESTLEEIITRASAFYPVLKTARRITQWAGLRPYRSEVRLEKQGNILYNYGHGGSGFTLAWGCAKEIVEMVHTMET